MYSTPPFTLGIEEEYLVVDRDSMELRAVPETMLAAAKERLHDHVSPEMRDCMIEIGTPVCTDIGEARGHLRELRRALADIAEGHGLAIVAASCHPFGNPEAHSTGKGQRYDDIAHDIGGLARRLMTCGMHVHVGCGEDDELRMDLMRQIGWFLPLVLGLSASSPYWKGEDTQLASWRLSVFSSLPRAGLPPEFDSWAAYRRAVDIMVNAGVIEDATKIWWDVRPSEAWPTLEVRIADVMPRLEEALSVAALVQSAMRMLWRLKSRHMRWRVYDRVLIEENRWRAERYGTEATLIDVATGELAPLSDLLREVMELMEADAAVLGCGTELRRCLDIANEGGSAARQRRLVAAAEADGAERPEALRMLLRALADEFVADLD
ncbi:glutamate--cysteine ligase family protein [Oceanicola granulosus HTCC2516]|uniref:Putative glutamate--cysteine ligase 2 n=1 Tax=Oceanicola granulosus (strain ATCC BAA-861 / DSM 15982 / KCTC 12143 / HTCC2516) TaxID=314256 RepID=Q2CB20_OCEGH|nr:carboxylate-amine ligase [Oceanicola granulosus]EAR49856.1 glutamate--cysteine ligase family protein [Oceanicola granulosus HTCC2516]